MIRRGIASKGLQDIPVMIAPDGLHAFMEPSGLETKCFQFGIDQLGKRGAVGFDGQKRQVVHRWKGYEIQPVPGR